MVDPAQARMHSTKNSLIRRTASVFTLFFVLALIFQIETFMIPPRADSAAWLFMGARQAADQMPGRDLWDNKLPLIYLIGRVAMASRHPQAFLWILEAMLTATGALAIFALLSRQGKTDSASEITNTRESNHRVGLFAGVLLCILSGSPSYHAGGYMTEIYAMPLSAAAVLMSHRAFQRQSNHLLSIGAGFIWALAVSFRLPMGIVAFSMIVYYMFSIQGASLLRALAMHGIGATIGCFSIMIHPTVAGYAGDCVDAAMLWPIGLTGRHQPGPSTLSTGERLADFAQDIVKLGWLHLAAIAGLVLAHRSPRAPLAMITTLWYVAALASAALGWASYAHYQYVAFAPIALATGLFVKQLRIVVAKRVSVALISLTALVVVGQNVKELVRYVPQRNDRDRAAVVRFISEHTRPDDTVYIWAWGRSAELLYKIDRPPGNRHFLAHAYFDMDLNLFNDMVEKFLISPPTWVIVDRNRNKPALIGASRSDQVSPMPVLVDLQQFIHKAYTKRAVFGDYIILRYGST